MPAARRRSTGWSMRRHPDHLVRPRPAQVIPGPTEPAALGIRWWPGSTRPAPLRRRARAARGGCSPPRNRCWTRPDALDPLSTRVEPCPTQSSWTGCLRCAADFSRVDGPGVTGFCGPWRSCSATAPPVGGGADGPVRSRRRIWPTPPRRPGGPQSPCWPPESRSPRPWRRTARRWPLIPTLAARPIGAAARRRPSLLSPGDRWRLVLGRRENEAPVRPRRYAIALDELYGPGAAKRPGRRRFRVAAEGGRPPFPDVREWAKELEPCSARGSARRSCPRPPPPGIWTPPSCSIPTRCPRAWSCCTTCSSLAGGLPGVAPGPAAAAGHAARRRAHPAAGQPPAAGAARPHHAPAHLPAERPARLARTLRANLATARRDEDGRVTLLPERPVFRTRARRSVDWRLSWSSTCPARWSRR